MFNTRYAEILLNTHRDATNNMIDVATLDRWLRSADCDLSRNEQNTLVEWASDHNALTYCPAAGVRRGEWLLRFMALLVALLATIAPALAVIA